MEEKMEERDEITQEELKSIYEETIKGVSPGDVVRGKVVAVTDQEAMVDIGYKAEGVVPLSEFESPPQVGDELEVYVKTLSHKGEGPLLSKREADRIRAWEQLRESFEKGTPVTGKVVRRVKGGFRVAVGGVEAFLPMSQADVRPVKNPDELLSKEFQFKVVDLNERSSNVILSRKQLLEEELEREKTAFWERMKVGKVFEEVERQALLPLPVNRFPYFHEAKRRVHRDGRSPILKCLYEKPPMSDSPAPASTFRRVSLGRFFSLRDVLIVTAVLLL